MEAASSSMMGVSSPALTRLLGWWSPTAWACASLALWGFYVGLKGWHTLGIWERRHVAFAVFTALLFINFLAVSPDFKGWADVYYFCGSNLQYCTCNFKWNALGWAKAYILWSFVLSSASGLQKVVLQLGLGGLLPGEEVVTRESVVSIGWRLIPYWLNNWEQQWGAECSSMMFELPHFAIELLVVLPCIQILCARLKVLAMPIVHVAPALAAQRGARRLPGRADNNVRLGEDFALAGGPNGRPRERLVVARQEFAPNILRGYWQHRPEQRRLMPRLRANLRVMAFALAISALALGNALLVPLMLESTISVHPLTRPIELAGKQAGLIGNDSSIAWDQLRALDLTAEQQQLLVARLDAFHTPHNAGGDRLRDHATPVAPGGAFPAWLPPHLAPRGNELRGATWGMGRLQREASVWVASAGSRLLAHLQLSPLRSAIKQRSVSGVLAYLLGLDMLDPLNPLWRQPAGGKPMTAPEPRSALQASDAAHGGDGNHTPVPALAAAAAAAAADEGAAVPVADAADALGQQHRTRLDGPGGGQLPDGAVPRACAGAAARFRQNLLKHSQEITNMKAPAHRAIIPLVESALAVMRLSCEKFFLLLAALVTHLLFRDAPPAPARTFIRLVAVLSNFSQRVVLLSFPAVCWVYGAGILFSMFVSCVFWGPPLYAAYDLLRSAMVMVRVKSLRHATQAELERMEHSCAICWADMHGGVRASTHLTTDPPPVLNPAPVGPEPEASSQDGAEDGGSAVAVVADARKGEDVVGCDAASPKVAAAVSGGASGVDLSEPSVPGDAASPRGGHATAAGPLDEEQRAWSLPCGHAYHHGCLMQWLQQCAANKVAPTCPMCQARIRLEVRYRLPFPLRRSGSSAPDGGAPAPGLIVPPLDGADAAAGRDGGDWGPGAGMMGAGFDPALGAVLPDADDDRHNINHPEGLDEVWELVVPMVNRAGLGRQPPGRLVRGAAMADNVLLPPPIAALGNMHMLRLVRHQRELQGLLADMPQIPPPDDVPMLQQLAAMQAADAADVAAVLDADGAAPPGPRPRWPPGGGLGLGVDAADDADDAHAAWGDEEERVDRVRREEEEEDAEQEEERVGADGAEAPADGRRPAVQAPPPPPLPEGVVPPPDAMQLGVVQPSAGCVRGVSGLDASSCGEALEVHPAAPLPAVPAPQRRQPQQREADMQLQGPPERRQRLDTGGGAALPHVAFSAPGMASTSAAAAPPPPQPALSNPGLGGPRWAVSDPLTQPAAFGLAQPVQPPPLLPPLRTAEAQALPPGLGLAVQRVLARVKAGGVAGEGGTLQAHPSPLPHPTAPYRAPAGPAAAAPSGAGRWQGLLAAERRAVRREWQELRVALVSETSNLELDELHALEDAGMVLEAASAELGPLGDEILARHWPDVMAIIRQLGPGTRQLLMRVQTAVAGAGVLSAPHDVADGQEAGPSYPPPSLAPAPSTSSAGLHATGRASQLEMDRLLQRLGYSKSVAAAGLPSLDAVAADQSLAVLSTSLLPGPTVHAGPSSRLTRHPGDGTAAPVALHTRGARPWPRQGGRDGDCHDASALVAQQLLESRAPTPSGTSSQPFPAAVDGWHSPSDPRSASTNTMDTSSGSASGGQAPGLPPAALPAPVRAPALGPNPVAFAELQQQAQLGVPPAAQDAPRRRRRFLAFRRVK